MGLLSKADILAAEDIKRITVAVPEWGGDVIVTTMSGADRDAYEQSLVRDREAAKGGGIPNVRARLCALSVIDEAGARMFGESEIEALGKKSAAALDRLYTAIATLNAMTAEAVAEAEKNS